LRALVPPLTDSVPVAEAAAVTTVRVRTVRMTAKQTCNQQIYSPQSNYQ